MKNLVLAGTFLVLFSCGKQKEQAVVETAATPEPEAYSFTGKPLFTKPAEPKALKKSDSLIAIYNAKGDMSEDDYVEIGKQLSATARFKMAIQNYTEGLAKFPNSYKLLRNRGHRYLNVRQLDNAIIDLMKAGELIGDAPDVMEYGVDGKPTATVRHQIWYHIGVYNYLTRDYKKSAEAFEKAPAMFLRSPPVAMAFSNASADFL